MGYADRNSANEAAKHKLHIPAVMRPQITEVGPPDGSARDREAARAVQEFMIAKARPSIASGEKLRWSSALWPRAASCAASSKWVGSVVQHIGDTRISKVNKALHG